MKIYQPDSRTGRRVVLAQPGHEFPNSDFMDEHGKPKMFEVVFLLGEADVADNLARYLVDKQMASYSPIILPNDRIAA